MTNTENFATVNSETKVEINCTHKVYGLGKITTLKFTENQSKPEIMMSFESETKNVALAYSIVTKLHLLTFDETDTETLQNLMDEYITNWTEYDNERKAKLIAEREAAKLALEAKKKEAEDAKKLKATMAKLSKMKPEDLAAICGNPTTEYETVGWLAKHIRTLKPSMPAEAQSWFESKFGKVDYATIYEKGAKTSNNNPMKYTLSIRGSFDAEVPSILARYASDKKPKQIESVELFWALVDKYNFQFGKKQNIDEIKKYIPDCYIPEFERGFAM